MRIVYTDASGPRDNVRWEFVGFAELVERADVATLYPPNSRDSATHQARCTPFDETHRLSRQHVPRPVIDEAALAEALETGQIEGAALDASSWSPRSTTGCSALRMSSSPLIWAVQPTTCGTR